jgi:hypothetical protein
VAPVGRVFRKSLVRYKARSGTGSAGGVFHRRRGHQGSGREGEVWIGYGRVGVMNTEVRGTGACEGRGANRDIDRDGKGAQVVTLILTSRFPFLLSEVGLGTTSN